MDASMLTISLLLLIIFAPIIIFICICIFAMDENKNEDGYNRFNSNMAVQCNAKNKCEMRFTTMCDTCLHNCGQKRDKNCYTPKI